MMIAVAKRESLFGHHPEVKVDDGANGNKADDGRQLAGAVVSD